jgi:hypothetical protein
MAVSVNSASDALRITQTGAGNALVVEDSANPDATPFVVTADGSVGIGTSSPSYRLSIEQSANAVIGENIRNVNTGASAYAGLYFGGAASATDVFIGAVGDSNTAFGGARSALFGTNTTTPIAFYTNGTEKMRLTSAGNLGIGTTAPETKLDVVGTSGTEQFRIGNTGGGTDFGINVTENVGAVINSAEGATTRSIQFQSGGTNTVLITAAGELNVGGTTAVAGASGFITCERLNGQPGIALFRNDTSIVAGNPFGSIDFYGNDTTGNVVTQHAYFAAVAAGTHATGDNPTDLTFGATANGSATATERMRLTGGGDLLVNTTTSGQGKLMVKQGASSVAGGIALQATSNDSYLGIWNDGSVFNIDAYYNSTGSYQPIAFRTSNTERARITAAGDVGIGTASPGQKLEVAGNVRLSGSQVGSKIENKVNAINVSTATTILDVAGSYGRLVVVNGYNAAGRFCDLVLASTSVSPTVVASFTAQGSPAARTYTRSGLALQLAMASDTYEVHALALGF